VDFLISGSIDLNWQFGRIMNYNREPRRMLEAVKKRHKDRYNVGFCDGHIESLPRRVVFGDEDRALRKWNHNHEPQPFAFANQAFRE
jgi:prepilin-type processing-associated H-X9-DG protein